MNDHPGIIAPPPLIYLSVLAAGLALHVLFPFALFPRVLRFLLGGPLIVLATFCAFLAFRAMHEARTPVDPYQASTALVVKGPYRFTRNPLYLSLTLLYVGISLLMDAVWALLLLPVAVLIIRRGVIDREERYLESKFGEEYLRYMSSVRRWI